VVDLLLGQTINHLKEFEEPNEVAFNTVLSNSLYHLKWDYDIGGGFNVVSGIQGGIQFNRNGEADDEPLIPDFSQLDNGIYSVLYWKRNSNERWRVQAGLRYDWRALEAFESEMAGTFKRNYQNVNGSIGVVWGIGSFLLRGNVSTGFRSPHVSELTAIGTHHGALRYEIGNPNLTSEGGTQFDGIFEFSNSHVEFIFNPFFNYIQNYIYANPLDSMIDDLPVFQYDQLSAVYLYGMDVGVHYHPHFAHWLHWESACSHIIGEGVNGIDLPLMSQNRLATSLKFTLENTLKGKFRFENVVVKHSAFFEQNRVSGDEYPSNLYQLIDLGLNMRLRIKQPLEFGIGVRNLLNEGYVDHLSRLKNIDVQQTGRNVNFRVKFTFNHRFKKVNDFDELEKVDVLLEAS
jgi:iron complex outermembrane receptor protein